VRISAFSLVVSFIAMFSFYMRNSSVKLYGQISLGMDKSEVERILWSYGSRKLDFEEEFEKALNQVPVIDWVDRPGAGLVEKKAHDAINRYKLEKQIDEVVEGYWEKYENRMMAAFISSKADCASLEYTTFLGSEPIFVSFKDSRVVFISYGAESFYDEDMLLEIFDASPDSDKNEKL
jgi:hypothetical protein